MRGNKTFAYLSLGVFSLVVLYPVVGLVLVSLQPPGLGTTVSTSNLTFEHFRRTWTVDASSSGDVDMASGLLASAIIASSVVVVATSLSVLSGFAFAVMRFRGSSILFYSFILGIIFPIEGLIVPLYYELESLKLLDTHLGIILPETAFFVAFGSFWMRAAFRSMPRSIIEAAVVDGAGYFGVLRRVLVPVARPSILTLMVLFFVWSWNDFFLPLIILSGEGFRTAPLSLAQFVGQYTTDISGQAAAAIVVSLPVLLVFVLLQRHFVRGILSGSAR